MPLVPESPIPYRHNQVYLKRSCPSTAPGHIIYLLSNELSVIIPMDYPPTDASRQGPEQGRSRS
jgi:hypothetical protein